MRDLRVEVVKAIREDGLFDFLCRHGYEMSKCELVDLAKELDYACREMMRFDYSSKQDMEARYIEALADNGLSRWGCWCKCTEDFDRKCDYCEYEVDGDDR